jgi:hypothetical protein
LYPEGARFDIARPGYWLRSVQQNRPSEPRSRGKKVSDSDRLNVAGFAEIRSCGAVTARPTTSAWAACLLDLVVEEPRDSLVPFGADVLVAQGRLRR